MKSILCVEDSPEIQLLVQATLSEHNVISVTTLADARRELSQKPIQLLLLDLELPDGDGMKFLAEMSQSGAMPPVFILTSRQQTSEKVIAFSLGVDDFVVKPFDPTEFRARVNAKLRKGESASDEKVHIKFKDLLIDVPKQRVYVVTKQGQESVSLTSLEFRLLLVFARAPDRVFSRSQLLDKVWGQDVSITDRTVDTHVGHLRKKISVSQVKIETVLNEGYRLLP